MWTSGSAFKSQRIRLLIVSAVTSIDRKALLTQNVNVTVNQRRALNEWLNPTPTIDTFDRIRSERLESSCHWIYQNRLFKIWLAESRWRICHMDGPPGCGKSTVVTKLIEDLRVLHPVAFFFCQVNQENQSWRDIIRTWIWQLLEQQARQELTSGVFDIYIGTLGTTTPLTNYFQALMWLVKNLNTPFIFLDGMDENPELQEPSLQGLSHHFRELSQHAKVFTSSRPNPRLKYTLPTEAVGFIRITVDHASNEGDISSFLTDGVSRLGWDEETSKWVHRKLLEGAKGMFLWVKLMLHHVQQQVTLYDLETAMKELPDGLNSVYAQILSKISSLPAPQAKSAARVLQWVYSATRPLALSELEIALAVKPGSGSPRLKERNRVMNIRQLITDICGPLLEIHERSGTVRFAHASALQYLQTLSEQEDLRPYSLNQFPLVLAKRVPYLAAICLTYLAYDDISFVKVDSSHAGYAANIDEQLRKHRFLQYAVLNLWTHFSPCEATSLSSSDNELSKSLAYFFSNEKNLVKWLQLYQLLGGATEPRAGGAFHPDASLFTSLKQYPTFRKLGSPNSNMFVRWDRWISEDSFNGHYCSPITIAAFFDFTDVVTQQLDAGVPVDDDVVLRYTPFLYAVHGDALDTVKLLLEKGADPTKTTKAGYGAARYVSRNCLSVLPFILGIEGPWTVQRDNYEGKTTLQVICSSVGWHPSVVNGFLQMSTATDLDQPDFLGRTALHMAASIYVTESADLLWDRLSRSPDVTEERGRRVLSASLEEAFTPTTESSIKTWAHDWSEFLRIQEGAPLGPMLPLTLASIQNLVQRIKAYILHEIALRNLHTSTTDHLGRTALHVAAAVRGKVGSKPTALETGDKEKSIKTLLEASVDPFLRDSSGQLPVDIAIAYGDWSTARALCMAMQSKIELSEDEKKGALNLQMLLDETKNETPLPAPVETTWMSDEDSYFPRSFRDMAEATLILRSRLSLSRSALGRNVEVQTRLVRRILDFAGYWTRTAASVEIIASQPNLGPPKVSLRLNKALVREIKLLVASERRHLRYSGDRSRRLELVTLEQRFRHSGVSSRHQLEATFDGCHGHSEVFNTHSFHSSYRSFLRDPDSLATPQGQEAASRNFFDKNHPFLRWERSVDENGHDMLRPGLEDPPLPPVILGHKTLWTLAENWGRSDIFILKQEWPIVVSSNTKRYAEQARCTREWLESLKEGDTITLTTAEGFSVQDIARFSMFGMVVYSVL